MSSEERELLNRSVVLAEENNKILLSMRRSQKVSQFMSFLYWVLIVGSAVGAYVLIQPYVDQLKDMYSGASETLSNFKQSSQ